MLPQRPPYTAESYARDDARDGACFGTLGDPGMAQRTLAALLRIEDQNARLIALLGALLGAPVGEVEAAPPAPVVLARESIEALAAAISARSKPGPKPKIEE